MKSSTTGGISRRHDLDALRAFAMFLGVALHAALPFVTDGWAIRDPQKDEQLGLFTTWIHGFRMPLFILVSGFFTMMMWRRRGLSATLQQRFLRVFLPLLFGLFTVLPAQEWIITWANRRAAEQDAERYAQPGIRSELVEAVRRGELSEIERLLTSGVDPDQTDPEIGSPALQWAARFGNEAAARILIAHHANVNASDRGGNRPLHSTAFFARPSVMKLLLDSGADVRVRRGSGEIPWDLTATPWGDTQGRARELRVPLNLEEPEFELAREQCRQLLASHGGNNKATNLSAATKSVGALDQLRNRYREFLTSDYWNVPGSFRIFRGDPNQPLHLIMGGYFDHLWFLWFLCWLVGIFALFGWLANFIPFPVVPAWLVLSPVRWLLLIPLTMIPQLFMGLFGPGFGPDTSTGLIPQPHILLYYLCFFGFGALYYEANDTEGRLGRWYWVLLTISTFILLPMGTAITATQPIVSGVIQVTYAWAMSFGLIGLFSRFLKHENWTLRYLSDSAYWIYLAHHPLVIAVASWIRPWGAPAFVKFIVVLALALALLLLSYQTLVRYSWLGWLLNGPRTRRPIGSNTRHGIENVSD